MYGRSRLALVALLLTVSAVACKTKPETVPDAPAVPVPERPIQNPGGNNSGTNTGGNPDSVRAYNAAVAATTALVLSPLYFEYDVSELTADAKANLDKKVDALRANPEVRIRVAGHCDSRGSDEYNIALGQRRAATARDYMVSRGIAATRIDIVSFGEENPAVQGESDAAWAKNRRDEFTIVAGAITRPVGN